MSVQRERLRCGGFNQCNASCTRQCLIIYASKREIWAHSHWQPLLWLWVYPFMLSNQRVIKALWGLIFILINIWLHWTERILKYANELKASEFYAQWALLCIFLFEGWGEGGRGDEGRSVCALLSENKNNTFVPTPSDRMWKTNEIRNIDNFAISLYEREKKR